MIEEKELCAGCTACSSLCPTKCIVMQSDQEGFLYPVVDEDRCIHCGLCEKICPVKNTCFTKKDIMPAAYLGYVLDAPIRVNCAAGGLFTGIAHHFIKRFNGVVFGAVYDEKFMVHHIYAENESELEQFQKSKYVQSDLENCYQQVKDFLTKGRYVLFSGTACQIYGLKAYLRTEYDRLYCIDLICYGVPSPKVFSRYLDYMEKQHGEIERVIVRDKQLRKNRYQMGYGILFKNGYRYFEKHGVDPMARIFYGKIASRPICYQCPFKTMWRESDLTIGDCWYGSEFIPGYVDKYGITLALCQSKKGEDLLNSCQNIKIHSVPTEKIAIVNGGMLYSSCKKPVARAKFFEDLDAFEFNKLADRYFPIVKEPILSRIREFLIDRNLLPQKIDSLYRKNKINKMLTKRTIPEDAKGIGGLNE